MGGAVECAWWWTEFGGLRDGNVPQTRERRVGARNLLVLAECRTGGEEGSIEPA